MNRSAIFRAANPLGAGIVMAVLCGATAGAFEVNGVIEAGEYTSAWDLDTSISGTSAPSKLFIRQTDDHLFVGVSIDIAYVDNVYGPDKDETPLSTPGSGWESKDHQLKKLTHSDDLKFTLNLGTAMSSNEQTIHVELVDQDNYNQVKIEDGGDVIQMVSTSFIYNYQQSVIAGDGSYGDFSDEDNSKSPDPLDHSNNPGGAAPPSDWQQALIYEFKFAAPEDDRTIGLADFSDASVHASPKKTDARDPDFGCIDDKDCTPTDPPGEPPTMAMPAPASGALFLVGLGLVSFYRRRKAGK